MAKFSKKKKWISTDAWRGYSQPQYAIVGASDTGGWSDSPAPTQRVLAELNEIAKSMRGEGFHVAMTATRSSNVFMVKRWLIVPPEEHARAKRAVGKYLATTEYAHEAD